jgi:hypothetical protein
MFVFDIETLGVESTSVVLSAAIVYFDISKNPSYQDLLDNALFVKFNSKDQIKRLDRVVDLGTLEWWKNQHEYTRKVSLEPSSEDVSAEDGIIMLHNYMNKIPNANKMTMWTRGSLDQMAIDSLCKRVDMQMLTGYNMYRDVRTAVDCFTGSTNGYCNVEYPGFDRAAVIKHHPVHDCALDAMMLMYGK